MADEEKRVVRTPGVYGTFHVGDVTISPEGTEVTFEEWMTVANAAVANQVVVRLDEDFPPERYAARVEKAAEEKVAEQSATESTESGTTAGGTDTSTGGRRGGARNGG